MRYVCSGLCAQIWACGWRPEADNRLNYSPFHLLRQSLSLELTNSAAGATHLQSWSVMSLLPVIMWVWRVLL